MLLDFTTTRSSIEDYIDDNFSECLVKFENVPLRVDNPSEYVAVFDKIDTTEGETLQSSSAIVRGSLIIQIFTKRGTGTKRARAIAQAINDLLNGKTIGGIDFMHGNLFGVPEDPKNVYYQHNLVFRYSYVSGDSVVCQG